MTKSDVILEKLEKLEKKIAFIESARAQKPQKMKESFYGIKGLEIIGHGEWADPEVYEPSTGRRCNYYDVEDPVYDDFKNELESENPNITPAEIDRRTEEEFDDYVKNNEDLVWEYFNNVASYPEEDEEDEEFEESKKSTRGGRRFKEGAGAGYSVTIPFKVDVDTVVITGREDGVAHFEADIKVGTNGAFEVDAYYWDTRHIDTDSYECDGGKVYGFYEYEDEDLDSTDESTAEEIANILRGEEIVVKPLIGGGYVHSEMKNPIVVEDERHGYNVTETMKGNIDLEWYGVNINKVVIDSYDLVDKVNYAYELYFDAGDDIEESVKSSKTKIKESFDIETAILDTELASRFLGRWVSDCEYILGACQDATESFPNTNPKGALKHLWANDIDEQIRLMKKAKSTLDKAEIPTTVTYQDIDMYSKKLHELEGLKESRKSTRVRMKEAKHTYLSNKDFMSEMRRLHKKGLRGCGVVYVFDDKKIFSSGEYYTDYSTDVFRSMCKLTGECAESIKKKPEWYTESSLNESNEHPYIKMPSNTKNPDDWDWENWDLWDEDDKEIYPPYDTDEDFYERKNSKSRAPLRTLNEEVKVRGTVVEIPFELDPRSVKITKRDNKEGLIYFEANVKEGDYTGLNMESNEVEHRVFDCDDTYHCDGGKVYGFYDDEFVKFNHKGKPLENIGSSSDERLANYIGNMSKGNTFTIKPRMDFHKERIEVPFVTEAFVWADFMGADIGWYGITFTKSEINSQDLADKVNTAYKESTVDENYNEDDEWDWDDSELEEIDDYYDARKHLEYDGHEVLLDGESVGFLGRGGEAIFNAYSGCPSEVIDYFFDRGYTIKKPYSERRERAVESNSRNYEPNRVKRNTRFDEAAGDRVKNAIKKFIRSDEDFKKYAKRQKKQDIFAPMVDKFVDESLDYKAYVIDKEYQDISWFKYNGKIYDMDGIYDNWKDFVKNY